MIKTTIICDKCKKIIPKNYPVWYIKQHGQYGSQIDGEVVNKQFCDDCLKNFINNDNSE